MDMSGETALARWWETSVDNRRQLASTSSVAAPVATSAARRAHPVLNAVTRTSAETTAFTSQRMQAALAAPARLMACKSPTDLMSEQMRFWQQATDQYNAALRNIQAAWHPVMPGLAMWPVATPSSVLPLPHTIPRTLSLASSRKPVAAPERDIITFRDPIETGIPQRERQAA